MYLLHGWDGDMGMQINTSTLVYYYTLFSSTISATQNRNKAKQGWGVTKNQTPDLSQNHNVSVFTLLCFCCSLSSCQCWAVSTAMGNLLRLLARDETVSGKVDIFLDFESKLV